MNVSIHLLGFCRVGLGINSEERKLLTTVVIHPLTEIVPDIKSPARSTKQLEQLFLFDSALSLPFLVVFVQISTGFVV